MKSILDHMEEVEGEDIHEDVALSLSDMHPPFLQAEIFVGLSG